MKPADIISQIKAENPEGYRAAIELYGARIHAFLLDVTGSRPDAEELTNDTFIKAFTRIHQYKPEKSAFSTWLFSIAHHSALSYLRKSRPDVIGIETLPEAIVVTAPTDNPDDDAIDLLQRAIAILPPEERSIIHQFYYEQASIEDISYVTGLSTGNVAVRLHRIRRKLKQTIESIQRHDR